MYRIKKEFFAEPGSNVDILGYVNQPAFSAVEQPLLFDAAMEKVRFERTPLPSCVVEKYTPANVLVNFLPNPSPIRTALLTWIAECPPPGP